MKLHLIPIRFFLVMFAPVVAIGCTANDLPPPASEEQLAQSIFTFYKNEAESGPSGILLSKLQGGTTNYLILTAGHVAATQSRIIQRDDLCHLGFRKVGDSNAVRRISAPAGNVALICHPSHEEDVGGFLFNGLEDGVKSNGGALHPIRLGTPFDGGVGIIRDASDYARYSITTGTEVVAFCSDIKRQISNRGYDWTGSVVRHAGTIRDLSAKITVDGTSHRQNIIVVDFASENGNSGGPVFAYGLVNGVRYPFLIGVISGSLSEKRGWAAVAPTWRFIKELEADIKSGD